MVGSSRRPVGAGTGRVDGCGQEWTVNVPVRPGEWTVPRTTLCAMNLPRTRPGRTPPAPRRTAVLAVLAAAQFLVMVATSIVNVALPQIRTGVGLSDTGTTWVVNAYGLAFGALLLAGGRASDLLGRRPVLVVGLALFTAGSLAAGAAARRAC